MRSQTVILRVAINTPLRRLFDYLPPVDYQGNRLVPGVRLKVPFGKSGEKTGLLIDVSDSSEIEPGRLKRVTTVLDNAPLIDHRLLKLMQWAADYYHHPVGEVTLGNLPALLSQGHRTEKKQIKYWRPASSGNQAGNINLQNAPVQNALLDFLKKYPDGISQEAVQNEFSNCNRPLKQLYEKNLVEYFFVDTPAGNETFPPEKINLNQEQKNAIDSVLSCRNKYQPFLLNGVTGSGKTEVYISIIQEIIKQGSQALVLVPEIGLTPQFINRFRARLDTHIAVLHSALTDNERMTSWLDARNGVAKVVIGTRSAIWTPFQQLGIIIIDEEHDLSYKQQEGFRYFARDLAVMRAQQENIPVVLASATPSLESLFNVRKKRYQEIILTQRAGNASMPDINILDVRGNKMDGALSQQLLTLIRRYLDKKQQVLLFLNRRGYAPVMMCHHCGWISKCPRCDIQMTYHKTTARLCCHHCGHQEKVPSNCNECKGDKIIEVGHGTQRIMETLETNFPDAKILRIDRDSTRRKGSMQAMLDQINNRETDILVGTQMLAKGHHFPGVTLVGVVDADQGLYSIDYRGSERLAQIITQVSGRSGRADNPGIVVLQTHHPDHPLLKTLTEHDYAKTTSLIMQERAEAALPPFTYQALLRADANNPQTVRRFLNHAKNRLDKAQGDFESYGPFTAPIEKRAGRFRMQLLVQSENRNQLKKLLGDWVTRLEELPDARKVRWSLDVDPQDML